MPILPLRWVGPCVSPWSLTACLFLVATASEWPVAAVSLTADGPFYLVRILGTDDLLTTNARLLGKRSGRRRC